MNNNLEMFKMSKAQMNKVSGGKSIKCMVSDLETGEMSVVTLESGVSADQATQILNETYNWRNYNCVEFD